MLLFISIFTIIISRVNALYECDLKKIIFLSTLRQLTMIILSTVFIMLRFYHLMTRAVFKSLSFPYAEIVIHLMKSNQE